MSISFDESLKTGNEWIDAQHRELIDRVNRLAEAGVRGKEKQAAVKTLDFLMDYTDFHFSAEEALQKETGYPEVNRHHEQHRQFEKAVDELRQMLEEEEGPSGAFAEAVKKNVEEWLKNHIRTWDKAVAEHVRGQA